MTIDGLIATAKQQLDERLNRPLVIMVAGGSATGKSSQVLPKLLQAFGDKALLVEQDWYQLGLKFEEKDTSPYRWDDPKNFQIERLATDLGKLKKGETTYAPSFDVVAVESVGKRMLMPQPVIVVDGIYTLCGPLADLADLNVYVSMPLYGRFLRRLFRMLYDQKQDKPQTAFKQSLGPVLLAHQDIVSKQAEKADCVIEAPYSFAETIKRYHLVSKTELVPDGAHEVWRHDKLRFATTPEAEGARFYIEYGGQLYYDFFVEPKYLSLLDGVDFLGS